ncbi:MAG: alcohol dehydrogenase catalytic domain-containing protein [Spirochaetales bacterium]|uniref:Alcohol dehydrogenase catalytic domain-containing protein n=1 Tax=Candidatus Thalassospirochaeta sargassi TaxID=3119039 RepID=A0AAJ1IFE4_9SPIO|nr:alcohol dehydrogenase catalytic domain-containing protein [Spirochaetales bacterium]
MSNKMKQAVMTAPKTIKFEQVDIPSPGPGEVQINIKRIGVCGSDIHVYHGLHPYTSYPIVQGHETAGEVTAIGEGVTGIKHGDKVTPEPQVFCGKCWPCTHGLYNICNELKVIGFQQNGTACDYYVYPADCLVKLPAEMSYEQGAMIEPLSVAVRAVKKAGDIRGKDVLVMGAGPIGNLVAQTAKGMGANAVMAADINSFRLEKAAECGIDYTLDSAKQDLEAELKSRFGEEKKADVIFECTGVQPGLEAVIKSARKGTDIVVVAVYGKAPTVDMAMVNEAELRLIGTARYNIDDFRTAIDLVNDGKVKLAPLVTDTFDFADYDEAYQKIAKSPETTMKVMIRVND